MSADYHEFGMNMEGRGFSGSLNYRFGYQGSEKDNEVNSSNGTSYTTEFRQLDTRLGRWFSSDPVFQPWQSSYTSMDNNPVNLTDVLGDVAGDKGKPKKESSEKSEKLKARLEKLRISGFYKYYKATGQMYKYNALKEAEKRGLSNLKSTPAALDIYHDKKVAELFARHNVLNSKELHARHEIMLENYIKKVQIESRVMGDLALNHVIPTSILYQNKLIENANGLAGLGLDNTAAIETIKEISKHLESINKNVHGMTEARKQLNKEEDIVKRAKGYCNDVKEAYFDKIRYAVDKLELVVDDELWPLVKYREMLFIK